MIFNDWAVTSKHKQYEDDVLKKDDHQLLSTKDNGQVLWRWTFCLEARTLRETFKLKRRLNPRF